LDLSKFLDDLRAATGAPGGGAAAAVTGAMGCALFQMVSGITLRLPRFTEGRDKLEEIRSAAETLHVKLLALAEEDAEAYKSVESAFRLPKATPEEKAERSKAIQEAFVGATKSPLRTLETCLEAMALLPGLLEYGNPNAITDVAVGFLLLEAAALGAAMNAEINLTSIKDQQFKQATADILRRARQQVVSYRPQLSAALEKAGLEPLR
jgi:formiminotetrahydrofolate cyclodeaminase